MIAILTDKPNVGKEIARILGAQTRENGYMTGNGYMVTWTFGNMLSLAMPKDYGIERPEREAFPLNPAPFKLMVKHVKTDTGWVPDINAVLQLKVIEKVFAACDTIIAATDASREGEMVFRYLYQYLDCHKPYRRLWISSLTDEAVLEGMANLKAGSLFNQMFLAADSRNKADWLLGLNASYAICQTTGTGNNSLGRVQTPTLMMICSRYLENRDFTPQTYYRLKVTAEKDGTPFAAISELRYETLPAANAALGAVTATGTVEVADLQRREVSQEPPLLYDLTALQKEANGRYGFSADKTLSIAQSLYEKKVLSYPRTGSRYLSDDVFDEIPDRIALLERYPAFAAHAPAPKLSLIHI